jgi:hypothetical protein
MSGFLMRGGLALLAIAYLPAVLRASFVSLDTVAAVRSLRNEQAAEARPVHLRGIVTFYDPEQRSSSSRTRPDPSMSIQQSLFRLSPVPVSKCGVGLPMGILL